MSTLSPKIQAFFSERRGFFIKAAIITLLVMLFYAWFSSRFMIAVDKQEQACLPWRVFLVDTQQTSVGRGDYFAFEARNTEPHIEEGTVMVKLLAAEPGDKVEIEEKRTAINGEPQINGDLSLVSDLSEFEAADLTRSFSVSEGEFFGMGTEPNSFDSRYWGTVEDSQIKGRVYPLF